MSSGIKRLFDVLGAAAGLVLLSPLLVIAASAIWISMGSPVLFRQTRPGLHEEPFELIKFRSMSNALNGQGQLRSDEERLTRLGVFLRKWSIDELPELVNVLRGEMSLVGPRPLLMQYISLYDQHQSRRHEVKPGLTGWAQVNGRNQVTWQDKLDMDVWYVDNRSFWLDFRILLLTFGTVISRKGVSTVGHATTTYFTGGSSHTDSESGNPKDGAP